KDRVAHGAEAVRFIGAGEEFGFGHAGPVGDGEEFHRFTSDLMEQALLNNQSAGHDGLANVFSEAVDGAISVPGDIRMQFERMAADRVTEEFLFPPEALEALGFGEWDGRKALQRGGPQEP